MNEIDKDFYCSANKYVVRNHYGSCSVDELCHNCNCYHRKHPTPEQFKEEYGFDVLDDMAVYCFTFDGAGYSWVTGDYKWAKGYKTDFEPIVVACTPFGKPDYNWRLNEKA